MSLFSMIYISLAFVAADSSRLCIILRYLCVTPSRVEPMPYDGILRARSTWLMNSTGSTLSSRSSAFSDSESFSSSFSVPSLLSLFATFFGRQCVIFIIPSVVMLSPKSRRMSMGSISTSCASLSNSVESVKTADSALSTPAEASNLRPPVRPRVTLPRPLPKAPTAPPVKAPSANEPNALPKSTLSL